MEGTYRVATLLSTPTHGIDMNTFSELQPITVSRKVLDKSAVYVRVDLAQ